MRRNRRAIPIYFFTLCLLVSGCGPGQIFGPTITPTPTITLTPTTTRTQTPTLTSTLTSTPAFTDTPTPTPRMSPNTALFDSYFFMINLLDHSGQVVTQFNTESQFCVQVANKKPVNNIQEDIFDTVNSQYVLARRDVWGTALGILDRIGNWSLCSSMAGYSLSQPGSYEYELWVEDVLMTRIPFEVIK